VVITLIEHIHLFATVFILAALVDEFAHFNLLDVTSFKSFVNKLVVIVVHSLIDVGLVYFIMVGLTLNFVV